MDKHAAARYARSKAEKSSTGKCARYVRLALMEGGGLDLRGWPVNAKDYRTYLPSYGFREEPKQGYVPEIGDVCVLDGPVGVQATSPGHMCIFDGTAWVSDFIQRDHWAGPAFRDQKVDHVFLRWRAPVSTAA